MNDFVASLRAQIAKRDGALLRFALGSALLESGDAAAAAPELAEAVRFDPSYSAAWKLLGRAYSECGRRDEATAAYARGIEVATARGDVQAAKEMRVFLKRLEKTP
jgi:predicted Zn-dependent protease